jgi:hypothetical protein
LRQPGVIPRVIYHYTSSDSFKAIISSKRLWATDYRYLRGDEKEIRFGTELVKQTLESLLANEKNAFCKMLLEMPLQNFSSVFTHHMHAYVACLCEGADQESQWRDFAAAEGRCIGFSTTNSALNIPTIQGPSSAVLGEEQQFYLAPVTYESEYQIVKIRQIIEPLLTLLRIHADGLRPEQGRLLVNECFTVLVREMNVLLPFFKRPEYTSEGEWRLMRVLMKGDQKVLYRNGPKGKQIPYDLIDILHWSQRSGLLPLHDVKFRNSDEAVDKAIAEIRATLVAEGYNDVPVSVAKQII